MNKLVRKKGTLIAGLSILSVVAIPAFAWAMPTENTSTHTHNNETSVRSEARSLRGERKEKREEAKSVEDETRAAKKNTACNEHKKHIDELMSRIDNRSERVYTRLTKISAMVQRYVKDKDLTVEGYDTLVTDINTKQSLANTKLKAMLSHDSFSCDVSSPRETVKEYRAARQAKVAAMKEYRQAIRTLLINVKQSTADQKDR